MAVYRTETAWDGRLIWTGEMCFAAEIISPFVVVTLLIS
jgi:hypothetical protein